VSTSSTSLQYLGIDYGGLNEPTLYVYQFREELEFFDVPCALVSFLDTVIPNPKFDA
jgi:hypothetical protein